MLLRLFYISFSGPDTINDDLYTISLIEIFTQSTTLKLKLPKTKNIIEKSINPSNENLCCVPFFKKADLIAITKSSLLVSIISNTQIA